MKSVNFKCQSSNAKSNPSVKCYTQRHESPQTASFPPYQVRGRLTQARNDKLYKPYAGMVDNFDFELFHSFDIWVLAFDIEFFQPSDGLHPFPIPYPGFINRAF